MQINATWQAESEKGSWQGYLMAPATGATVETGAPPDVPSAEVWVAPLHVFFPLFQLCPFGSPPPVLLFKLHVSCS